MCGTGQIQGIFRQQLVLDTSTAAGQQLHGLYDQPRHTTLLHASFVAAGHCKPLQTHCYGCRSAATVLFHLKVLTGAAYGLQTGCRSAIQEVPHILRVTAAEVLEAAEAAQQLIYCCCSCSAHPPATVLIALLSQAIGG